MHNELEDFIRNSIRYGIIAVVVLAGTYEGYKFSIQHYFKSKPVEHLHMAKVTDAGYRDLRPQVADSSDAGSGR